jgi:hypothetical protein
MNSASKLFIRNIPEIKEREFKYRSQMSSHELNELQTEAFKDILDLFNKSNLLQKQLYEFNLANNIETTVYNKRLNEILFKLYQTEELYNNLKSSDTEFRYQSKFVYEAESIRDDYSAVINKETNDITEHIISSVSKTHLYDETYDEILIPDSIHAYIGPDSFAIGSNIYSIEDSDVKNIFDTTDVNIWYRKVITNTNVDYIENEIIISLPEDIITTRLVNEIIVKPFPIGYMDIMDVQYKTNGAWTRIPGFDNHFGAEEESYTDIFGNSYNRIIIPNANNLRFNFKALQINQIKIKMRQRNFEYDSTLDRRIWYLGLRNVDVLYNRYSKNNSIFSQVFEFPETDRLIKVYDAEVMFNNASVNAFNIIKEYYYFDSSNNYHRISGTAPFILNGHKMLIKFYIEGNEETPNIYMTKVKYKLD